MASPCDDIELFVDGELPAEQAESFRQHFADCPHCQAEFTRLLELNALARRHAPPAPARVPAVLPFPVPSSRWRRPLLLAAACLTVVLGAGVMVRLHASTATPPLPQDVWLETTPERPLEARLSHDHSGADRYRRPPERMMGGTGAAPSQDVPYESMALLKQRGDVHGLALADLLHGNPDQALKKLQDLGDSVGVLSDQAVALLGKGRHREALQRLDAALARQPRHPEALWNRSLVLRDLGLHLLAARSFREVAALEEPGWSTEASDKANALQHDTSKRRDRWQQVFSAGKTLVNAPPGVLPEGFAQAPIARLFFYDAVRSAPTRERVEALRPLAKDLDARAGGTVLEEYVLRVAEADFTRRGRLAQEYARLASGQLAPGEQRRLLDTLRQSGEEDLLLGALVHLRATEDGEVLKRFERQADTSGDPWFTLLSAQLHAAADKAQGRWSQAARRLEDALRLCPGSRGLEYRCIFLERELSGVYLRLSQFDAARSHAEAGLQRAREGNEWALEGDMLWVLANLVRFGNDASLGRAYFGELLERAPGDADVARRVHENLASIALHALELEEARRELDAALATGQPLSLSGALTLADIARLKAAPGDEQHFQALERARPKLSRGDQVIATHVQGRFYIERDAARGRALLEQAIQEAAAPGLGDNTDARRARTYSFTSLVLEAGRRRAFEEAMVLLEQERGQPLPGKCLLVATVDSERTLVLVRDQDGTLSGHYDASRRQPLRPRLEGLVPERLLEPLRPCNQVEVLARPPLHGRAGLLPPELAWSYLTRTRDVRTPPTGPEGYLVVSEIPPSGGLPRLDAWEPSLAPGAKRPVMLTGAAATPQRVLEAMRDAREIDLATHGIASADADASYLLLAGGELRVSQLQEASLRGAPFIVVAACHAAIPAYSLAEPLSLPAALFKAGARGVLAATVEIPERNASRFFGGVRERIRAGAPPAVALRDERMQWLRTGGAEPWLDSVLLFE